VNAPIVQMGGVQLDCRCVLLCYLSIAP